MHPHPAFRLDDVRVHDALIEQVGFGMVFAPTPDGLNVAHTPFVATGTGAVRFHLSNGNALTAHLDGGPALLLVNGPDAYVSPRWYGEPGEVPTWNYVALELEGPVRRLDEDELEELLVAIGERQEGRIAAGAPWDPAAVPEDRWSKLIGAITGFELTIEQRRPTFKLSQNKPTETRAAIAAGLEESGAHALAALMQGLAQ